MVRRISFVHWQREVVRLGTYLLTIHQADVVIPIISLSGVASRCDERVNVMLLLMLLSAIMCVSYL